MICTRCHHYEINRDGLCPKCGYIADPASVDLADLDARGDETADELRARHDAATALPGVTRLTVEVGNGAHVDAVDWEARCRLAVGVLTEKCPSDLPLMLFLRNQVTMALARLRGETDD